MFTTSVVVAIAVGAGTWFSQRTIDELTASQLDARRTAGEKSITRESDLVAQAVANAVAHPLANTQYSDIQPVLDAAMHGDHARGDDRLRWLVVTDNTGVVVAKAGTPPDAAHLGALE